MAASIAGHHGPSVWGSKIAASVAGRCGDGGGVSKMAASLAGLHGDGAALRGDGHCARRRCGGGSDGAEGPP